MIIGKIIRVEKTLSEKNFIFSTIKHKSDGLPGCRRRVIELIAHLSVQLVAWEFKPYSFPKIHAKLCDFELSPDQSHSIIHNRSKNRTSIDLYTYATHLIIINVPEIQDLNKFWVFLELPRLGTLALWTSFFAKGPFKGPPYKSFTMSVLFLT